MQESSVRRLLGQLGLHNEGTIDLKLVFIQLFKEGYISEEEYALIYHSVHKATASESNAI